MPSIESIRKNFQAAKENGSIVPAVQVDVPKPIPVATYPAAPNPNLRTPLPAISVMQPDMQRQWQTGATPQQRISPPSRTGNPIVAAQTISTTVVQGSASVTPITDIESIAINKQTGTAYTVQVSDLDTLVTFSNNSGGTITLPGPGKPFSFVQFKDFTTGSSNIATTTITNGDGNLLYVTMWNSGPSGFVTFDVSDTQGNQWGSLNTVVDTGNERMENWYASGVKPGSNTITVTASGGFTDTNAVVMEYSGIQKTNPLDVHVVGSSISTTITTTTVNALVILSTGQYYGGAVGAVGPLVFWIDTPRSLFAPPRR